MTVVTVMTVVRGDPAGVLVGGAGDQSGGLAPSPAGPAGRDRRRARHGRLGPAAEPALAASRGLPVARVRGAGTRRRPPTTNPFRLPERPRPPTKRCLAPHRRPG